MFNVLLTIAGTRNCFSSLSPSVPETHDTWTSAGSADTVIVSMLLEAGANLLAADGVGATALINASYRGHTEVRCLDFASKSSCSINSSLISQMHCLSKRSLASFDNMRQVRTKKE